MVSSRLSTPHLIHYKYQKPAVTTAEPGREPVVAENKKFLVLTPFADAYVVNTGPATSLKAIQSLVGGRIELVTQPVMPGLDVWVHEEGRFQIIDVEGRPYPWPRNPLAASLFRVDVVGNTVVTRTDDDGHTLGLTDDDLRRFRRTGLLWAGPDHTPFSEWDLPALVARLAQDQMVDEARLPA